MPEFIFTMTDVTRVHPPDKRVLENIHLAFYPGAKIGVLGVNGSGKSSLLRIMAGVDKEFIGEAKPHPGTRIGYFAQEPELSQWSTVKEAVDDAVSETRAMLTEFEEVSTKLGEPMSDDAMNKLLERQAILRNRLVVDHRRPDADRMPDRRARRRPVLVDRTHPAVTDHPLRICPSVGQHVPHPLARRGHIPCHTHPGGIPATRDTTHGRASSSSSASVTSPGRSSMM